MAYSHLTSGDRMGIESLIQVGKNVRDIALILEKSAATIYREIKRNRSEEGYHHVTAQIQATTRKHDAAAINRIDEEIWEWVKEKICSQWSPEQISERMKIELGHGVSHEWIYQMVYADKKEGGDLHLNLRWGRRQRKKRGGGRDKRGQIPSRVSIEERDEVVDKRERLGDFEGDTMVGANHQGFLVTHVDRTSRLTLIEKAPNKSAEEVTEAALESFSRISTKIRSITYDNGKEFSHHEKIAKETGAPVYFAHPYSSYERGTNENTNGLIRQYFPKKSDFTSITPERIERVEHLLNNRPRKILGYKTPNEVHYGVNHQYFDTG